MSGKLEQRIQSAHLTRTEKVIADYFLEHSGSLYFLTAKDIALALGVSDTSVIRLCRTLGVSPQQRLTRLDAYLSGLQLY